MNCQTILAAFCLQLLLQNLVNEFFILFNDFGNNFVQLFLIFVTIELTYSLTAITKFSEV